jgi:hypothetical protein
MEGLQVAVMVNANCLWNKKKKLRDEVPQRGARATAQIAALFSVTRFTVYRAIQRAVYGAEA